MRDRYDESKALTAWFASASWPDDFLDLVLVRALADELAGGAAPTPWMLQQLRLLFNTQAWERVTPECVPTKAPPASTPIEDPNDFDLPF